MAAESAELWGLLRVETRRRNVPSEILRLTDDVEGCAAARGCFDRNVIGIRLEVAAVKGHDAEAGAQAQVLFDSWMREKLFEKPARHDQSLDTSVGVRPSSLRTVYLAR